MRSSSKVKHDRNSWYTVLGCVCGGRRTGFSRYRYGTFHRCEQELSNILGRIGQSFVVLLQVGWRVTPAAFHKDQKGLLQHPKRLRI